MLPQAVLGICANCLHYDSFDYCDFFDAGIVNIFREVILYIHGKWLNLVRNKNHHHDKTTLTTK